MSNKQETHAEVIAGMREYAQKCREKNWNVAPEMENHYNEDDVDDLADRLEAAHKRELAEVEASALSAGGLVEASRHKREVGDCAKLREALEHLDKLAREFAAGNYYISGFPKLLQSVIQSALSAPARNCDVYEHDEALQVWAAENENERNGCFDEWLYHEATEKEGGNDGNE